MTRLVLAMIGLLLARCADPHAVPGPNAVQHLAEGQPVDVPPAFAEIRAHAGSFSSRWDLVKAGELWVGSPIEVDNRGELTVSVNLIVRRHVGVRTRLFCARLEPIGAGDLTFVLLFGTASCRQEENEESDSQPPMDWTTVVDVHDPVIPGRVSPNRHRR